MVHIPWLARMGRIGIERMFMLGLVLKPRVPNGQIMLIAILAKFHAIWISGHIACVWNAMWTHEVFPTNAAVHPNPAENSVGAESPTMDAAK